MLSLLEISDSIKSSVRVPLFSSYLTVYDKNIFYYSAIF